MSHEVCFLSEDGRILGDTSFSIPNTLSGFEKLQQKFDVFSIRPLNCRVGMEATGHYWMVLYSWLTEKGFTVELINPIITDAYRHLSVRKAKTDRIDALIIAKVLCLGEYEPAIALTEETLALRQLCRFRLWEVDTCSDLKRKAIALIDQIFPEFSNLFSDMFGMSAKELLVSFTTPEEMARVSTQSLARLLHKVSRGRFGLEKAEQIQTVAKQSIGLRIALDGFVFQLRQIIEQLEFVEHQIENLDQEIAAYMERLDSPIQTIPGIGPVYGSIILSEIGDISRFPGGKQLVSFAGLDASVSQSGDFTGTQMHMSKRGSPYLRRAIFGAAMVASRADPELATYYQGLKARGKHHYVAVGAVARKLCYIIYAVLSENRAFITQPMPE